MLAFKYSHDIFLLHIEVIKHLFSWWAWSYSTPIILLLTQVGCCFFFWKIKNSWVQQNIPEKLKWLQWCLFRGHSQSKSNIWCAKLPESDWRQIWEVLVLMQLSKTPLSLLEVFCYFDVIFTAKIEQELVIHITVVIIFLINWHMPYSSQPAVFPLAYLESSKLTTTV